MCTLRSLRVSWALLLLRVACQTPGRRHKPRAPQSAFVYGSALLLFRLSPLPKLAPTQTWSARCGVGQRPDSAKHERTAHAGQYLSSKVIRWVEHAPSKNLPSNARC